MHAIWAHAFHILRGRGADQTNTRVHAYNTIMECVHACTIVDHHIGLAQAFFSTLHPFNVCLTCDVGAG